MSDFRELSLEGKKVKLASLTSKDSVAGLAYCMYFKLCTIVHLMLPKRHWYLKHHLFNPETQWPRGTALD